MAPKIDVKRTSRGTYVVVAKHVDEDVITMYALACVGSAAWQPLETEFSDKREAKASARLFRQYAGN
jgi:hypothetical protein